MVNVLFATVAGSAMLVAGCGNGIESAVDSPPVAVSTAKPETWFAAEFIQTMIGMELSSSDDPAAEVASAVQLAEADCHVFASEDISPAHTPPENAVRLDELVRHLHSLYPAADAQIRQGLILQAEFACPDYVDMLTAYDQWASTTR